MIAVSSVHTFDYLPCHISLEVSVGQKIVIFYTETLTGKVVLWCFLMSKTSEKIHNSTFLVKISVICFLPLVIDHNSGYKS